MLKKILLSVVVVLVVFLSYVSTRESKFNYERSEVINAPAEKIFPYLSNFKLGSQWSPYEKIDPNMKKSYSGTDGAVGSVMEFDGNNKAGSGKIEILSIVPNQRVDLKLTMTKPFKAENHIVYRLTPDAKGTRFTWSMDGDGGFLGKLISVFIDCEKMVGDQFGAGIENLKGVVEK